MEAFFQRARKLIAFILVLAMNQMILGPIFILDTYAASTVFTDNTSLTPVQSDTVQIDATTGTDITSAKWVYYFGSCPSADYTSATSLTLVDTDSATTSFTISDESHNGEYVCVEVIDNGLSSYASSNPIMVDVTPPVITLSGSSTVDTIVGASYTDSGATCTDNMSSCNVVVDLSGVNFNATGSYTVNFSATDVAGNAATGVTRTVNVVDALPADTTPPVVTVVGDNPQNLLVGDTFVDSGATWTDNVDGSGVIANYNSGTINTSVTGSYSLEYIYVDAAGNTGSTIRTVNVVDVIPSDTTAPVVTLNGSGTMDILSGSVWTDPGATWTDDVDGSGTIATASSGTVDTTLTGSYILEYIYVDAAGNTGSTTRTVNVVDTLPADTTPPVVTVVGDNPQNLLVGDTFVDSGATWTDNVDGSGVIANYNSGTINTSVTGSYSLEYIYVDAAGNTGSAIRTVNVTTTPDTTPPTATVEYSTTGATNQSVVATLTGASESITITNNSGSDQYTFTTNGLFTFEYQDAAGNTGSTTATVSNIDLVPPTAVIDYTPSTTTSGAVIATLTGATENIIITNNSGSDTYIFTNTGSFTFDYVDDAGNTGSTTATVTWIDLIPPSAMVEYSTTAPTNGTVVATLTGASESITITNNSGSDTYIFSSNGTFTFDFEDAVGNTGSVTATVSNIDTTAPVVTLNGSGVENLYQNDVWTDLGATWIDNVDGSGVIANGVGLVNTSLTGTYTVDYTYTDVAGNTTTITRTINVLDIPDTTPPTAIVEYSTTGATNQPVIATLTGSSESITITNNSGSNQYTFTDNGTFTFDFVDGAGNTGSTTATVSNIDLVPPTATVEYSPSTTTSGSVIATLTGASEPIIITNNLGSEIYTFTGNGVFTFDFIDIAGNTGSTLATVGYIDPVPPVVTVSGEAVVSGEYGVPFVDDGATWTDNVDGSGVIASASSGSVNIFALGTYILEYFFQDSAGNTGNGTRTVHIVDTTVPVVTVSDEAVVSGEYGIPFVDDGATWTDAVDGSGTITSASSGSVNIFSLGTYILEYFFQDSSGNTGSTTRTVNIIDTTAPVVTVSGEAVVSGEYGVPFIDDGAIWTDNVDGSGVIASASSGSVNIFALGTYILSYIFQDSSGNTGSTTRTVHILDTTAPIIILNGSGVENLYQNDTWTDLGATWTDAVDGSGVIANGTGLVNTSLTGTYTVDYTYVDTAGNTGSATRTINVLDIPDTTPPTATVEYSTTGATNQPVVATLTGASESITITNNSGSTTYTFSSNGAFTFDFVDNAGNTGSAVAAVNNIDTTSPVVTLIGSGTEMIFVGDIWVDLGATWTDNVDGSGSISTGTGLVNTSLTGTYTVDYVYVDTAGNTGSVTRFVHVLTAPDIIPPVLTLSGATPLTVAHASVYVDAGAICTDNIACVIPVTVSGSVDTGIVGTYILTYSAQDIFGNPATPITRVVHVVDMTAPVITLNGSGVENLYQNDIWTDLGATWIDNVDGSGTIANGVGLVNTSLTGSYAVTYTYVDAAGNTGSAIRTVNVLDIPDTTPPTATIEYSITGATNQPVVATLTGASEPITITNNSGSNQYTFNTNGTFTFDYQDAAGNTGSTTATVTWIDVTVPTATVEYSNTGATNQNVIATLTGASEPITITNNSGSNQYTFNSNGTFTFDFVDAVGNTGSTTATVGNIDTVTPVVTLSGTSPEIVAHGSVYVDAGATWTDNVDGSGVILSATSGSVNTSQTGTYLLQYAYTDTAGNTGLATRTVSVTDQTAPVITLSGATPMTVAHGSTYVDAGATCTDNVDTTCTVTVSGAVNTSLTGTYILSYSAVDVAGNVAIPFTRTVNVVDLTAPIITLVGTSPLTIAYGSTYTDSGATCTDNLDTTCTVTVTGSVNTSQTGTYLITYDATDLAGNAATPVTRTVNVTDLTTPVVTLNGLGAITLTQGATWLDPGATWSDNLDGTGSLTGATIGAVNTAVIGTYTLTYVHIDLAGNIGSTTRTVNVIAVPPPAPSVGPGGGGGSNPLFSYLGNLIYFFPTKTPPVYTGTVLLLDLSRVPVQYRDSIRILKNKNILPDFDLTKKMTRIEFVRILAQVLGYHTVTSSKTFADIVPDSETARYVAFGVESGWINTRNIYFRPYDSITLGEAMKILGTIVGTHRADSPALSGIKVSRAKAIDLIVKTLGLK